MGNGHSHTLAPLMHCIAHIYLAAIGCEMVQGGLVGLQQAEGCRVFRIVPQFCTHRDVGAGEVATNCGASEESRLSPVLRQFAAK